MTDNKRIKNDQIIGVGYYNAWANLKMNIEPNRSAFTRHLSLGEHIHIPIAHGEGRFIMSDELLKELIDNEQATQKYLYFTFVMYVGTTGLKNMLSVDPDFTNNSQHISRFFNGRTIYLSNEKLCYISSYINYNNLVTSSSSFPITQFLNKFIINFNIV